MGGCYLLAPWKSNRQISAQRMIILASHRRKLLPMLVMLFALTGLSLSMIGEAFSHGAVELASDLESQHGVHSDNHGGHGHSHSFDDEEADAPSHHDAGNHTHETVDQLRIPDVSSISITLRQSAPFAGDSPRSLRYRLERPPKTLLSV